MSMIITLAPKEFFKINLYFILFLLCANILGIFCKYFFHHDYVYGLIPLFDFNTEKNIPTLYSTMLLLFSSMLLAIIAHNCKRLKSSYIPWLGLSMIFLYLSIDEIAVIHERLGQPVKETLGASGFLYYGWVLPYGVALVVLLVAYSKFIIRLPKSARFLFLLSGAIFVSGAVGFEMLGGKLAEQSGSDNLVYALLYTCEEFLEMLGISIFIYALLAYIVNRFGSISLTISENRFNNVETHHDNLQ